MRCSIQPKDQIFVKGYGFLSFAKNIRKTIGKIISKDLSGKYSHKLLDLAIQSAADALKINSKNLFKKQQKQLLNLLAIKLQIKIQKSQELYHRIVSRQSQIEQKMLDFIKK